MCDLNQQETGFIVGALTEIRDLAARLDDHIATTTDTAYMQHEELAALLTSLRDQAEAARAWVTAKPLEHTGHDHSAHEGHQHH